MHESQVSNVVIANIRYQISRKWYNCLLTSLIEDWKEIWEGVEVFDAHRWQFFFLRAILLWTINDFPSYDLSGYSVKGHKVCLVCEEETFSIQLKHGRKRIYLCTRRFLPVFHCNRRLQKAFNRSTEEENASKALNAEQVYQRVKKLNTRYEKVKQNTVEKNMWKKRPIFLISHKIFFYEILPWYHVYWEECIW